MRTTKLLGSTSVKVRVVIASLVVLVARWLIAPRTAGATLAAPSEAPAPLLEEQAHARRELRPLEATHRLREQNDDVLASVVAHLQPQSRRSLGTLTSTLSGTLLAIASGSNHEAVAAGQGMRRLAALRLGPLLTRRALIVTGEAQTIPAPLVERS